MNYFGNFDAKVSGAQLALGHVESTTVHATHVPSDAIVVPDAQLLFGAEFKRTGVDLVLSGDGREFVLHDYFKGEKHAPLASPDGAHLTGDLVNALAGQVEYAQAGGNAAAGQVIGHVTKLAGTATAVRNGVSIILNNGDNVEKGDVVASGSDSTVGITFIDGTVFGLSSNARMVLNEMIYDPNGSNNSSLLSLVAGTITFVAGETAKHGDMKVDTPVATMGIRGTAVLCEIDFSVPGTTPDAKFQVLVEPDGTTGSYILFDKTTLTPLAVVDQAGMQINISNGIMSQTLAPLSPEIQKLITDVFSLKFTDSTNTKSLQNFTDTVVPTGFTPFKLALGGTVPTVPIIVNLVVPGANAAAAPPPPKFHIPEAPSFQNGLFADDVTENLLITCSNAPHTLSGKFQYFDVNTSDHDTVSVNFSSFTYQNAKGQDVTGSLSGLQLADILKVEAAIDVSQNTGPNNIGNGTANWSFTVADKALDFLAAGEKLTLTYTATVDNNFAPNDQSSTQQITITITGSNDVPVITSSQQNIAFNAAGTGTHGGDLLPDTATAGTLAFKDVDLTDTHTVAVKMASALLDGHNFATAAGVGPTVISELEQAVTVSIPKGDDSTGTGIGTIDWVLANLQVSLADLVPAGESLVLTYVVTVTDSQGATAPQDIVVTIGGDNGAAVVWDDTNPIPAGGALWSTASNWEGDRVPNTDGFNDDVFIGTDQVLPATPTFPATINDAEAAKSLTMDYFTDFGTSIPELDVLSTGSLTISGALNMGTSEDPGSPLTAETIIKNFGTISVGDLATLLKHSVLDNYGTITLDKGGLFGDQSSITNSGTIEVVGGTLDVEVGITNFVTTTTGESPSTTPGLIQIDDGATLKLSDGATITKGGVTLGNLSVLDVEKGAASLPAGTPDATLDGVTVTGTSGSTPSVIEIGTLGAATLLLDDGTIIKNGDLTIGSGSALDITTSGATLDGVNVTGTNGSSAGAGAMLGGLFAGAGVSVPASTIEVGTATTGAVLTLDDGTTITNGNLIIDSDSTLEIAKGTATLASGTPDAALDTVNVTNSGFIQIDAPATLALNGVTISGGGAIDDIGTLSVTGASTIEGENIEGGGDITVASGQTLTLTGVTMEDVTLAGNFTNTATLVTEGTVTLNDATISGGTIQDVGEILVTASSEIENATVDLGGDITVTSGTLTLSDVTLDDVTLTIDAAATVALNGTTISGGNVIHDAGTLSVTGSSTIKGESIDGGGDVTVTGGTLTLTGVTMEDVTLAGSFTNTTTLVTEETVTLNDATISGGTIQDVGTLSVTVSSEIENATVDGGGDITVASGQALTLSGVVLDDVTLSGSFTNSDTLTIDGTVTLNGATISGGTIDDTGTLSVTASSEIEKATVDGGGDVTVASGQTLTLSGVVLDDVTVSGSIFNGDTLTIDAAVTLDGATLAGNTIDDTGTLSVTASSEIKNATVDGGGDISVTAGALTLSEVTLGNVTLSGDFENADTLTIKGTVTLDGATVSNGATVLKSAIADTGTLLVTAASEIENATVNGGGDVTVTGGTLTLSGVTLEDVTLAGSFTNLDTLTIDETVTLDDATISGGTIKDAGTLLVTASSEIENATVDGGDDLTVTGGTLTLSKVTLDDVTLSGSFTNSDTLTINETVTLNDATISGGTIKDTGTLSVSASSEIENATVNGGGDLTVASGQVLTLSKVTLDNVTLAGSVTNSDTLTIKDTVKLNGATLNGGTIADTGTLSVVASSEIENATVNDGGALTVTSGTLTLATVTLDNVTLSGSVTNSGTLTIDDTVTFNGGTITGGTLDVVGELDTTGTSFITDAAIINLGHIHMVSGSLVIDPTPFTNLGLFEVSSDLTFSGELFTNSGLVKNTPTNGTLQIDQSGTLTLENSTIDGGIVSNGGLIDVTVGSSIKDTFSFVNAGTVNADGAELDLIGLTVNNSGGTFKTTGKGILGLENTTVNSGTLAGAIATIADNTSSTLNGATLAFGTLVTAAVGVLELTGTIFNYGEVDATTGVLDLSNATIHGGTFGGDGTIATISHFNTFNGVTIADGTTVSVADSTTLDLVGTISDAGTVALGASGHLTGLEISGNVSLTGGGNVTMTNDTHNFIVSDGSAATLTNSDTISGAGTIGDSHLTLVNNGTIDATGSHALIIDTGVNSVNFDGLVGNLLVTNNVGGVLEASAGHTLLIEDNVLNNGLIESGNPGSNAGAFVNVTGNITGTGSIEIFNNSTVEIGGSVSAGQTVTFGAPGGPVATNGLLILQDSHDFHGTIVGLTENQNQSQENQVDLDDLAYLGPLLTHAHFNHNNDTVTVGDFFDAVTLNVSGNNSGSFEVSSDGHGGTLLQDPAASGNVTVDSGQTLEISAASSATIDFANSDGNTGALVLDDSKDFTGEVVGFAGDGTTANSDLIDVADINIADVATNKTTYMDHGNGTGTLTLYNASGQALDSIDFAGNYQLANFTIENDGDGGTLIVDPPVKAGAQTGNPIVAPNHNSAGTAVPDGFLFNFAGPNHAPTPDFHPDWDSSQPGGSMLTNLHTGTNPGPDLGNTNVLPGGDGHDHLGVAGLVKAHLNSGDFHFV